MATRTQIKEVQEASEAGPKKNEIAVFQPPRLPYHDAINERFGVDRGGWKVLVEAIFPSAKTVDAIVLALSYCKTRALDPFKRPVHIVPMWDSRKGGYVETIWPSITELRTTAFRTKQYAGCDEAEFGETLHETFRGRVKRNNEWQEAEATVSFPEWCRITVYRELGGRVCKFVGPKVKWLESYATIGNSDVPNDMWQTRPDGQIEKCAEAAALRKAFPEELGNELTAEEMAGRRLFDADEATATPARRAKPAQISPPAGGRKTPLPPLVGTSNGEAAPEASEATGFSEETAEQNETFEALLSEAGNLDKSTWMEWATKNSVALSSLDPQQRHRINEALLAIANQK